MAFSIVHNKVATLPDQPGVEVNKAEWNDNHGIAGILGAANGGTNSAFFQITGPTVVARTFTFPDADATVLTSNAAVTVAQGGTGLTSGTSGGILAYTATGALASSALLAANGVVVGGGAGAAPFTSANFTYDGTRLLIGNATNSVKLSPFTDTFSLPRVAILNSSNAAGAGIHMMEFGAGSQATDASGMAFLINGNGGNAVCASSVALAWSATTQSAASSSSLNSIDTSMLRGGANQIVFSGSAAGGGSATSRAEINKNVTAIADNVATATVTVTVPNGAHSAGGKIVIKAAAGAGGAIGADEFSVVNEYDWVVARTTGVNAVATLTAVVTGVAASVAGGAAVTLTAVLSAISGAVGATNTFTLNVTIAHGSGSSTNHTCFVYGTLLNDNATGVTIA